MRQVGCRSAAENKMRELQQKRHTDGPLRDCKMQKQNKKKNANVFISTCAVVFMFCRQGLVWSLTFMRAHTMPCVLSTHSVTVDPDVNSRYPGNRVVGKNVQRKASFLNNYGGKKKKERRWRHRKMRRRRLAWEPRQVSVEVPKHLLTRAVYTWLRVNTSMAESLAVPWHTPLISSFLFTGEVLMHAVAGSLHLLRLQQWKSGEDIKHWNVCDWTTSQ